MDEEIWITAYELVKRWGFTGMEEGERPALYRLLSCIHDFELLPYGLDGNLIYFFNKNLTKTNGYDSDGIYFEIFAITRNEIKFKLKSVEEIEKIAPNYILILIGSKSRSS